MSSNPQKPPDLPTYLIQKLLREQAAMVVMVEAWNDLSLQDPTLLKPLVIRSEDEWKYAGYYINRPSC